MAKKEDFQKFLEKKLQVEKARDKVLKKEINGLELVFVKTARLERKALSVFKEILKDCKVNNVQELNLNITLGAFFSEETTKEIINIIYESCKTLQNSELHKTLDVSIPERVVETLFTTSEIFSIGMEVVGFLVDDGDKKGKLVEKK